MKNIKKIRSEFYPKKATRDKLKYEQILTKPSDLPSSLQHELEDPSGYIADDGLADALNVALVLGQPLLLTGEPGSGKTQFAYSAMFWLGFERLIRFNVKSTTQAPDFFYQIDEIRRFRDAQLLKPSGSANKLQQSDEKQDAQLSSKVHKKKEIRTFSSFSDGLELRNYMTLGPLGEAILRANSPNAFPRLPQPKKHIQKERSVVLIDEIDKAARDVPNDLLNEFENMEFEVPELKELISADLSYRPVLIITSNSERNLPDAFLRRCIYYNIPFPGEAVFVPEGDQAGKGNGDELERIVLTRLSGVEPGTVWLKEALELFRMFRIRGKQIQKRPGVAELLNWSLMLHRREDLTERSSLKKRPELFRSSLSILMKNKEDAEMAFKIYSNYRRK